MTSKVSSGALPEMHVNQVLIMSNHPRGMKLRFMFVPIVILAFLGVCSRSSQGQQNPSPAKDDRYLLGMDDQVKIRVLDVDELDGKLARIDSRGNIDLPLLGSVKAAGFTVEQLQTEVTNQLRKFVQVPRVSITVTDHRSRPVSVLGAVNNPGVYNLVGSSTLEQVLSKAGGLRADAGNTVYLTRRRDIGNIPLPSVRVGTNSSTAEVDLKSLLNATNRTGNIRVEPTDIITVPKAALVYVVGAVNRPGGFVLSERPDMTILQALSMAQGLDKFSSAKNAKILRATEGSSPSEVAVNVSDILAGKSLDLPLRANDILYVPSSTGKKAALRAIEAAVQTGTFAGGYAVAR